MKEFVYRKVSELKPHPLNEHFFENISGEQKEILLDSIKSRGVFHTLVVTPDGTILSGHQRWMAAKELGIEVVPCRIVDVDPNSAEARKIILEANLAQRTLTPETYRRCFSSYEEEAITPVKIIDKLIPELQEALKEGKLKVQLARALARFSHEDQKSFLALIGAKIEEVHRTKLEVLQKTLEEKKQMLEEASRRLKLKEEEIEGLKKQIKALREDKKKIKASLEELTGQKERFKQRIAELTEEIEHLRLNPPPEVQAEIQAKEQEIEELKSKVEEKDEEIAELKKKLEESQKVEKRLQEDLQKERKEKNSIQLEMERKFNEKLKEEKEKWNKERKQLLEKPPLSLSNRYHVLLDLTMTTLAEIQGAVEDLSSQEKQELMEKLKEIAILIDQTIGTLAEGDVKYDYEEYEGEEFNRERDEKEKIPSPYSFAPPPDPFLEELLSEDFKDHFEGQWRPPVNNKRSQ
jgi:ParB-like chromosome segregation protein Spo0J